MRNTSILAAALGTIVACSAAVAKSPELLRDRFIHVNPGTPDLREIFVSMPFFETTISHLGHRLFNGDATVDESAGSVSIRGDGAQGDTTMTIIENDVGGSLKVRLSISGTLDGEPTQVYELKRSNDRDNPGWKLLSVTKVEK